MNNLIKEIIKAIGNDSIPQEDYWYDDDFIYVKGYTASGTLKYNGKKYKYRWNHEEGIFYDTIEEVKE